ncbi:exonuclease domain-containing protein [Streptomyces sp. NPDC096136]|uniref:exonuclease domain-containing protein n=1 Tax=Streptomyces sp. NPDC096136 TaxID=3366076 RepID=UPI0037F6F8C3
MPVYGWGQAPSALRTQTQLGEVRLKLAEGQPALAYIRTRKYGDVPLYDPAAAVRMRPLASVVKGRMEARRTCPVCGEVRASIVRGRQCAVCWVAERRAEERRQARTCRGCQVVRARPLPAAHGRCGECRRAQLAKWRERAAAWVEKVTVCAGEGCTVRMVTKKEARAVQASQGRVEWGSWWRPAHWPERCAPCAAAAERRHAERRAEWERQEAEQRAEQRRRAEERKRWAAAALADPTVCVLDTETSGLHPEARIIEIAVVSSSGEVLLDTLVNPGVPIPEDASAVHGIVDADVVGRPTFSAVLPQLSAVLDGRRCLIYNAPFDVARLRYELTCHHLENGVWGPAEVAEGRALDWARERAEEWLAGHRFEDVMIPYSDWVGDWSEYHGANRWQALGGGHRAAGDCLAVLERLGEMGREYADEYAPAAAGAGVGEA